MSQPRFPIVNPADLVSQPSGVAHAAAGSVGRRVSEVERALGALATRLGTYAADSTITTDAGASAAQDITSITVVGDGVTPIIIEWGIGQVQTSGVVMQVIAAIWDGAGATGTRYTRQGVLEPAASVSVYAFFGSSQRITHSGSKTFYLHLSTTAGTADPIISSTQPAYLRARWAP